MKKELQLRVLPEVAGQPDQLRSYISKNEGISFDEIRHVEIMKRSIDARQKQVIINLKVQVYVNEHFEESPVQLPDYPDVSNAEEVIVIGVLVLNNIAIRASMSGDKIHFTD